jgi:hypothetical protein
MSERKSIPNPFHISPAVKERRNSIGLSKAVAEIQKSGRCATVTALDGKPFVNLGTREFRERKPVAKAKPAKPVQAPTPPAPPTDPIRASLDRRIATRKQEAPSPLGKAIIERHPRRQAEASAVKAGRRLDFKRASEARRKER